MPSPEDKTIRTILWIVGIGGLAYFILKGLGDMPFVGIRKREMTSQMTPVMTPPITPAPIEPTTTEGQLKQIAMRELNLGEEGLSIRSLRPEDLGLSGAWSFNIATPNAWNNILSASLGDNRFLAITGCSYTGSAITQIRMVLGGRTAEIWNIQSIPFMETPIYIDLTPTIIKQNQSISIDVYSTGTGTESLIFEGIVVEKKGLVIA